MEVVFAALQQTLLHLASRLEPPSYAELLRQITLLDSRGLNLVRSLLAPIAGNRNGPGFETIDLLFQNFKAARPATFPVIEASYRMLCDAEYRVLLRTLLDASLLCSRPPSTTCMENCKIGLSAVLFKVLIPLPRCATSLSYCSSDCHHGPTGEAGWTPFRCRRNRAGPALTAHPQSRAQACALPACH
jgi:hypothetical protein